MDKIGNSGAFIFRPDVKTPQGEKKKNEKTKKTSFLNLLRPKEDSQSIQAHEGAFAISEMEENELVERIDGLRILGEKLAQEQRYDLLMEYKNKVQAVLRFLVSRSIKADEEISGNNILKQKKFTLLKVVDEKLNRLTASILSQQSKQLDILNSVGEIHGMLVDFMH